jgi:hypothetical protein
MVASCQLHLILISYYRTIVTDSRQHDFEFARHIFQKRLATHIARNIREKRNNTMTAGQMFLKEVKN